MVSKLLVCLFDSPEWSGSLYGEESDGTLFADFESDTLDGGPGTDHNILGNDTGDGVLDHVHISRGEAADDVVYGFESHDVLWIDGAVAAQAQLAALGGASSRAPRCRGGPMGISMPAETGRFSAT